MKNNPHALLAAALGGLALAACDTAPPEPTHSPPGAAVLPVVPPQAPEPAPPTSSEVAEAEQAIAAVMHEADPTARARRLAELLPSLGPEAVPAVRDALREPRFRPSRGGAEIELLARFWAAHAPEEATRWAINEAPAGYRLSAVLSTLSRWAEVDPSAARGAAESWEVHRPDVRDLVQLALVQGWFEADPSELAGYIARHEWGRARQRKLSTFVRLLTLRQGSEAAQRWAESVPEDDTRYKEHVYRQLASALGTYDLEAALSFCETHCGGPYGRDIPSLIGIAWGRRPDGDRALEWLSALPEGRDRNTAVRNVFATWAQEHPKAAVSWMKARFGGENADPEPWLQVLIPNFALLVMLEAPADAISWAERVEDANERKNLLLRIARAWRYRDEAAAEAWLSDSPLSEEERERARQLPPLADRPRT